MQAGHPSSGVALAALLCVLGLGAACGGEQAASIVDGSEPEPPCDALRWVDPPRKRNVVLIVNDTMRVDRVGIHGGPANTPVFDAFARQNLHFTRAYSQAPWTKPSIATLFTGLYPSQHAVITHPWLQDPGAMPNELRKLEDIVETDLLSEDLRTLAEVMLDAGYRTAGFVSNPWLRAAHGFGQGFEFYDDKLAKPEPSGQKVSEAGIRWLDELPEGEHFFMYLHYMDSHRPYGRVSRSVVEEHREALVTDRRVMSPSEHGSRVTRRLALFEDGSSVVESGIPPTMALLELIYDHGIEDFDEALGSFLEALSARPDFEETAVIVTSDHGEALFTRGMWNHGFGLFDEEVAVPMAMRLPGLSGQNPVECAVGLVDMMASLCVYLGLECSEDENFGVSFVAPYPQRWRFWGRSDDRKPRYLASEGVVRKPRNRVIRNRRFKLIFEPKGRDRYDLISEHPYSLFAILPEGGEGHDLLSPMHRTSETEAVFAKLSAALANAVPAVDVRRVETVPLDSETLEHLEALGYLE
jgi:arylsulfatase A-like enzyme